MMYSSFLAPLRPTWSKHSPFPRSCYLLPPSLLYPAQQQLQPRYVAVCACCVLYACARSCYLLPPCHTLPTHGYSPGTLQFARAVLRVCACASAYALPCTSMCASECTSVCTRYAVCVPCVLCAHVCCLLVAHLHYIIPVSHCTLCVYCRL